MNWNHEEPTNFTHEGPTTEYTALIVEQVHKTEDEGTTGERVRFYRRIGILRDLYFTHDFRHLIENAPTYNYGRSEQIMETLVLV